jgi:copper chaperone NosL
MSRSRRHALTLLLALLVATVAGCEGSQPTGPGEVVWDRDVCEQCEMVIGVRRHAAQARDADSGQLRRFDDVGCAVLWLAANEPAQPAGLPEVWVRNAGDTSWIDGRTARFSSGHRTPMGHGYASVEGEPAGSLNFEEITRRLLAERDERRHPGH